MAIVPRQTFPWQQHVEDVGGGRGDTHGSYGEDDEQGTFYSSADPAQNQLWVRRPGYLDVILPPPGFSIWDLPSSKLQTTAVAITFLGTAAFVTALAGAGMLAILVTGAVVSACVLLLVTVCTAVVAVIVTGVPVGYAAWQLLSRYQQHTGHSWGLHSND